MRWGRLLPLSVVAVAACHYQYDLAVGGITPTPSGSGSPTPSPGTTPNVDPPLTLQSGEHFLPSPCSPVTAAPGASATVTVTNPAPFRLYDRVFLFQVQVPDSGRNPNNVGLGSMPGVVSTGSTGPSFAFHQLAMVVSTSGGTTLLLDQTRPFALVTAGGGSAELCRAPRYALVQVPSGASLIAVPWNGTSGGVIAFSADTLMVDGGISADGDGFRPGGPNSGGPALVCGQVGPNNGLGGGKGEGNDGRFFGNNSDTNGMAEDGLGGGGGDPCGTGGGGGGNGGSGGAGSQNASTGNGGAGGITTAADPGAWPTFGGGGGGGSLANSGNTPYGGGAGGGLVWIEVGTSLTGGGILSANGADGNPQATASSGLDGLGGAGAGGSIVLVVASGAAISFTALITANGGAGGTDQGGSGGGGGGGGGGRIRLPAGLHNSNAQVAPGRAGLAGGDGNPGLIGQVTPY